MVCVLNYIEASTELKHHPCAISSSRLSHRRWPRPVIAKHAPCSTKHTTRGVGPSVTCVRSLCTPMGYRLSPACHHRPSKALTPGAPWRRPPNLASAPPCRRRQLYTEALQSPGGGGAGGALPQTPGQKYRLFYLLCCRGCQAPFPIFFLSSLLFFKGYAIKYYLVCTHAFSCSGEQV